MEKIGPKTFFLPFPLTFRSCKSPTLLSSCVDSHWGLSQCSQVLAVQLGIGQLHLRRCGMPASLPGHREPRPAPSQNLQASHILESLGPQARGVLPGISLSPAGRGWLPASLTAHRPCLQAEVPAAKSLWQTRLSGLAQHHRPGERGPACAYPAQNPGRGLLI